jgi:hypothetical protein
MAAAIKVHPVGLVTESDLVTAARRCILDTLTGDGPVNYDRVSLAKWVLDQTWVPED